MKVYYPKRSSHLLSNFLSWLNKWCLLILKSHSNLFLPLGMCLCWWTLLTRRQLSPSSITVNFGRYAILRSISINSHFKEHIQNYLFQFYKKVLVVGSSVSSHLDFGILRFSINIWRLIKKISINNIACFWCRATDEGLLPETIV